MPPWTATLPRSTIPCMRRPIGRFATTLRCHNATLSLASRRHARSASTHVSPTAINYRPNIPKENQDLYNALSGLNGKAEQYVNLSRLQLAMSGLTVENAVTRVAVLGLNSQIGAQRLARLLLADPLREEGAWEKALEETTNDEAVLLRYGDETDAHPSSPLYKIISVPSRVLGDHNLEILISTLNVAVASTVTSSVIESPKDAVLVPKLHATSARGLSVPYPVHKALLIGEDLDAAMAFGRFTADSPGEPNDVVKVAIDLPGSFQDTDKGIGSTTVPVNVSIGYEGIDAFRKSVANSITYERHWFASNLPSLSKWLVANLSSSTSPSQLIPAQSALVSSILNDVESSIIRAETRQLAERTSSTPLELSDDMSNYLDTWAEKAHEELRDTLDEVFSGKNWAKLKWWKLGWRVDDVGMVSEEVLERRWLVDAEKDAVYLAGRMKQAGFPDEIRNIVVDALEESSTTATEAKAEGHTQATSEGPVRNERLDISTEVQEQIPWPSFIATTRSALLRDTIPPLQALAQRLILTTLSTTSLSSALSALLYISMPSFSLFEAGAVAAVGLMFSLRRMQKSWEGAREAWQLSIREEGRQALKGTEELVRLILRGGKGKEEVDTGVQERREAREAVQATWEALKKMNGGQ